MGKNYKIEITETYKLTVEVFENTRSDAIYKTGIIYNEIGDGCTGIAVEETHVLTDFKVTN